MFWNVQKWTKYNNILERTKIDQTQFWNVQNGPNTIMFWYVPRRDKCNNVLECIKID